MLKDLSCHYAWCIVRYFNGRFERVREGYGSMENARRGLQFAASADAKEGNKHGATYAIGKYLVGDVMLQTPVARSA